MYESAQSRLMRQRTIPATILLQSPRLLRRQYRYWWKGIRMSIGTIVLIILVLALVGVIPAWPHSSGWGYGPSGGVGLIVVVLLILLLMGRI